MRPSGTHLLMLLMAAAVACQPMGPRKGPGGNGPVNVDTSSRGGSGGRGGPGGAGGDPSGGGGGGGQSGSGGGTETDAPGSDLAIEGGGPDAEGAPDPCQMNACELAAPDGCCPAVCNADNDADCNSTCGNELVERGETCDLPSTCPLTCPNKGCTAFRMEGLPETCNAECVEAGKVMDCKNDDGCCPMGCTTLNDKDCQVTCGNGAKEGAELCDPLSTCPITCPPMGCQLRRLVNPGTCNAECINAGRQTQCVPNVSDGCCPVGCNNNNDSDCPAKCRNGIKEAGEMCDPCPAACPQMGCQLQRLENPGTCNARCVPAGTQTQCRGGDGCCPPGCNDNNDSDCNVVCGNRVKEAGELCDPCPTTCAANMCQLMKLANPGTCNAQCVPDRLQTECRGGDGCCPTACNETNDSDCKATCGNRVKERGERCDPCPTTCPQMGCQLQRLADPNTCNAQCVSAGLQTQCRGGDSCCPTGCNNTNDSDCTAACGNRVKEAGELCDGNCPTSCPNSGCQLQRLANPGTCNAQCVSGGNQTQCRSGDGCCPGGCNNTNDSDCQPVCGNRVKEGNELCDGNCPTTCQNSGCQLMRLEGAANTCNARCVSAGNQTRCQGGDACCPTGCNANNDNNCTATCGNNVREGNEVCDGNCPASCPNQGCTARRMNGTGCGRSCVNNGVVCVADGTCCPGCTGDPDCGAPDGRACNAAADCTSRVCSSFYEDRDGDGFGGALKKVCGSTRPPGFVTNGNDCCDESAFAHPGQQGTSQYSPNSGCALPGDVNCDGREELGDPPVWRGADCTNPANEDAIGYVAPVPTNCRQEGSLHYCENGREIVIQYYPGCR